MGRDADGGDVDDGGTASLTEQHDFLSCEVNILVDEVGAAVHGVGAQPPQAIRRDGSIPFGAGGVVFGLREVATEVEEDVLVGEGLAERVGGDWAEDGGDGASAWASHGGNERRAGTRSRPGRARGG